jgi:hypothetical protein
MRLISVFYRPRQAELHVPSYPKDLEHVGAQAMAAGVANPPQRLEYHPVAHERRATVARTPEKRRSLGRTRTRRVQLNVDVSPDLRRELKAAAKRQRRSLSELVAVYCRSGLDRDRQ